MSENKFVSAFSVTEAVAVQSLKDSLPEILTEAFESEDVYTLWGVPLDKSSEDDRIRVLLVKFLRARAMDVAAAKEMLVNTLKWRKEFKTDTILEESFDDTIYTDKVGFLYKTDIEGRPVTYNFYGGLDQDKVFGDVDRFVRWRIQLMEKGVREIDFIHTDSMVQVHDYEGVSIWGRTANTKAATAKLIELMQNNYPEFLSSKLFVNVPSWGSMIFKLIRPLLPEATLKKFVIASYYELSWALVTYIGKDNIPSHYAGMIKDEDVEKVPSQQPKQEEEDTEID